MSSSRPTRPLNELQPLLAPKGRRRLGPLKNPLPLLKTTSTVKLVYANFQFTKSEDADSYVNGKMLDLSSSSLNSMVNAPDAGKKFFETMDEVIRPTASDLSIPRRILHHMVCNIILPRTGKFEYITFLDLFVMYCLITHTPMNLGHLMINHMKAATEKKRQGLPYGMFFTHMFHILDIDLGVKYGNSKASKEYNQKTLRLMGFTQNDEGFWIKKADATPQKRSHRGSDSDATARMRKKIPLLELLPLPPELQRLRESHSPSSISFFAYGVIIPNTPFPLMRLNLNLLKLLWGDKGGTKEIGSAVGEVVP
ncbi:hypothetical protein CJ030_MR5G023942 [Morella rubra]|uniref:Putative plant transposon protein domain-containing protein n=1 Tax=Morella rubra TaxID=262757 RepID=A0A6A1VLR0_9ROSI|nr:hypothetical protein CJ030_MR5G023942 [Morella rubra]